MTGRSFLVVLTSAAAAALTAAPLLLAHPGTPSTSWTAALSDDVATIRLVVASSGNEARYRIQEKLMGMDLPYDAVGRTRQITGAVVLDGQNQVVPSQSRIRVGVNGLTSDKERRDRFVRSNILETAEHPWVELVPTSIRGPIGEASATGEERFELVGDLTVRGVTRPTTWQVVARFAEGKATGTATTGFTFEDFELSKPRVPMVLSLADTIRLEYDFSVTYDGVTTF